jgi:hypothetical protein
LQYSKYLNNFFEFLLWRKSIEEFIIEKQLSYISNHIHPSVRFRKKERNLAVKNCNICKQELLALQLPLLLLLSPIIGKINSIIAAAALFLHTYTPLLSGNCCITY